MHIVVLISLVLAISACKDSEPGSESPDERESPSPSPNPSPTKDPSEEKQELSPPDDDEIFQPIMQLVAGTRYNCALSGHGEIKCWGEGNFSQLGQPTRENIGDQPDEMGDALSAVKLGGGRTAKAVSVGISHTCAILDNNAIKCWGVGSRGILGQGNNHLIGDEVGEIENLIPVNLGKGRTAKAVSVGYGHTCAILDDGTVKCWGGGGVGKLGNGKTDDVGDAEDEMGDNLLAIDFGGGRTAKAVSAGGYHTCAILSDDTVKCWGSGVNGKLGQGNTDPIGDAENEIRDMPAVNLGSGRTAKALSAGNDHTCAILDDDTVKCWGSGIYGQLGYGNRSSIGNSSGEMGSLLAVNLGEGRTAKAISAGSSHTCVILDNDMAKCWGSNSSGQLGTGNTARLGDNRGEMAALKAIDLGNGRTVKAITAGEAHACALLDNDVVKCWGSGRKGQLGNGKSDKNLGDAEDEMGDKLPAVALGFALQP